MTPDEGTNYVEKIKLVYDLNKHLTTLASATVVVFITFISSYFLTPGNRLYKDIPYDPLTWFIIIGVCFILIGSICVAVINMYRCYGYLESPSTISERAVVMFFAVPTILYGFGLVLAILLVWAVFH
jgi:hypothetical protein